MKALHHSSFKSTQWWWLVYNYLQPKIVYEITVNKYINPAKGCIVYETSSLKMHNMLFKCAYSSSACVCVSFVYRCIVYWALRFGPQKACSSHRKRPKMVDPLWCQADACFLGNRICAGSQTLQCRDPPHQSQPKYTPISHSLPHIHTDSLDCRGRHCINSQHRHAHIWSYSPGCGKQTYPLSFGPSVSPCSYSHSLVHTRLNSLSLAVLRAHFLCHSCYVKPFCSLSILMNNDLTHCSRAAAVLCVS